MSERAMRFGYLLSEVELGARRILAGREPDVPLALTKLDLILYEAKQIALEVSREALDEVVDGRRVGDVPSEDIEEALRRYEP